MICPHCGRSTSAAEICQHCHKPTEFTTRFNSRPGEIPGIEDAPVSPPAKNTSVSKAGRALSVTVFFCVVLSMIACALCIICLLQIGRMTKKEELPPVTVSEATSMPEVDCVVIFDWNQQDVNEWIPSISKGQKLPTLQDREEYLFTGWNTDPNGNGTSFRPGEIFDLELKRDLTLYAQWEPVFEQMESAESETEAAIAAQEDLLSGTSEPDTEDDSTFAAIPDPLPKQESEENYG